MVDRINEYIKTWEGRGYAEGIPDEADPVLEAYGLVPSYRRIALAILKCDPSLKTLGFTPKKSPYYHALKKIEIAGRNI